MKEQTEKTYRYTHYDFQSFGPPGDQWTLVSREHQSGEVYCAPVVCFASFRGTTHSGIVRGKKSADIDEGICVLPMTVIDDGDGPQGIGVVHPDEWVELVGLKHSSVSLEDFLAKYPWKEQVKEQ